MANHFIIASNIVQISLAEIVNVFWQKRNTVTLGP